MTGKHFSSGRSDVVSKEEPFSVTAVMYDQLLYFDVLNLTTNKIIEEKSFAVDGGERLGTIMIRHGNEMRSLFSFFFKEIDDGQIVLYLFLLFL